MEAVQVEAQVGVFVQKVLQAGDLDLGTLPDYLHTAGLDLHLLN